MSDLADWTLGFMTGTSMDGVDAALIRSDGADVAEIGASASRRFSPQERAALKAAAARAAASADPRSEDFSVEAAMLADACADAAAALPLEATPPSLIGFHGQTLLHRPAAQLSLQIGDARRLAARLNTPVVHDFRSADVAAGGQGAPFAPFYHFAMARRAGLVGAAVVVNLGGVANVTWVDPSAIAPETEGALLAFDTGPASALIDDLMAARTGRPYDVDGATAACGQVDAASLRRWMDPSGAGGAFAATPAPKSLDRDAFSALLDDVAALSLEDAAATLTAFSAAMLASAAPRLPSRPKTWLLAGGGRRNATLVAEIDAALGVKTRVVETAGFDGDMIEAQAFAHLARRSVRSLPLSAPGTTGAPRPVSGGVLVRP